MKTFLFTLCFLLVTLPCLSQEKLLDIETSVSFDNINIKEALLIIENETGVGFVFSNLSEIQKTVEGDFENETIRNILIQCFDNTNLKFQEIGDKITIYSSKKEPRNDSQKFSHTLSGYVYDKETGEVLIGSTIFDLYTLKGTTTNEYGFYSLSIPKGRNTIVTSYLAYAPEEITFDLQQNIKQDFYLTSKSVTLEEVSVVETIAQKNEISTIQMTPKKIARIPTLLGEPDLQQFLLSQPGVTSNGEGTSGFNVRGGKVDQNLILVDEASLYNTSHLFGFITVVNNSAVKDVKFYKAGIPAKFGGRSSSVVDIRLKEGNSRDFFASGSINPIASKIGLEFPIVQDKLNVFFHARRSFVDLLLPLFQSENDQQAIGFHDATFKINYKIGQNDKLFLTGFSGHDILKSKFVYSDDETENNSFVWGDQLASLRWNHTFSNKVFSNLSLITSNFNFDFESNNGSIFSGSKVPLSVRTGINGIEMKYDLSIFSSSSLFLFTGFGAKNNVFTRLHFDEERNANLAKPKDFGLEYYYYIDAKARLGEKLKIRSGLRFSGLWNYGPNFIYTYDPALPPSSDTVVDVQHIKANKTVASFNNLEPRLAVNYQLNEKNAVKLAYDRLVQYVHLMSNTVGVAPFDVWSPANNYLPPTITDQYTVGYANSTKGINISADIYYKQIKNLIEFRSNANLFLVKQKEAILVPASIDAYGIELSVDKSIGKLQGFLNYTYSRSLIETLSKWESLKINQGNAYPSNYDRPHIFNMTLSYPLSNRLTCNSKFTYQSGRPVTLPEGRVGNLFMYSARNSSRLPSYHRLDLSFILKPKKEKNKKIKGEWVFSILNVYARKNVFSYFVSRTYDTFSPTDENVENPSYQLRRMSILATAVPTFAYNFKF